MEQFEYCDICPNGEAKAEDNGVGVQAVRAAIERNLAEGILTAEDAQQRIAVINDIDCAAQTGMCPRLIAVISEFGSVTGQG